MSLYPVAMSTRAAKGTSQRLFLSQASIAWPTKPPACRAPSPAKSMPRARSQTPSILPPPRPTTNSKPTICWPYIRGPETPGEVVPTKDCPVTSFCIGRGSMVCYSQNSKMWTKNSKEFSMQPGHDHYPLRAGAVIRLVSWNLNRLAPDQVARVGAALSHIRQLFDQDSDPLVVMFQELSASSKLHVLGDEWVRQNFFASFGGREETHLIRPEGEAASWQLPSSSCVTLVSRRLRRPVSTRVQFGTGCDSRLGKGVLVTDVRINAAWDAPFLRLCNTHLTSERRKASVRRRQLADISSLLKGKALPLTLGGIIAGVVGGDLNVVEDEHGHCRDPDVDLNDAWDGTPGGGDTWGHQSGKNRVHRRLDRFLYTGSAEPLMGNTGTVELVGKGLKTECVAWELQRSNPSLRRRFISDTMHAEFSERAKEGSTGIDPTINALFARSYSLPAVRATTEEFVSDHYGITVRMRLL